MEFLKPDKTYTEYGMVVKEKLITAASGVRYFSNRKLATTNHRPAYITIHNTDRIKTAAGTTMAEQYSRATYNNNMGDVVVHYYIDNADCWHILADDTVGWHAADGVNGPGNTKSVAIEIIMDGSGDAADVAAEDRGAKLAAILLHRYGLGIDRLKTHRDWYPKKYCPAYILGHWGDFKAKVERYLKELDAPKTETASTAAPATSGKHWRVQVGYYGVKANAEAMRDKLKKAGFSAIIKEE